MHSMFCLLLDSAEQIREEIGIKLHLLSRFENYLQSYLKLQGEHI